MKDGANTAGSNWPDPVHEKLLRACFLPPDRAAAEFRSWRAQADLNRIDQSSLRLFPLLLARCGSHALDPAAADLAQRVRLTNWRQNQLRLSMAASLLDALATVGVESILLKGIAILERYYGDTGLRAMGDVDLLVRRQDVPTAVNALLAANWRSEGDLPPDEILRMMRVRHAWQFSRGEDLPPDDEGCDLHWQPVVRCYSPFVTEQFWNHAESVPVCGRRARVPSATEQLFHTCAHGLQWDWTPSFRWAADALTILGSPAIIDWARLVELARAANMTVRVHAAMLYLRTRIEAPVPQTAIEALAAQPQPRWERREHILLQKPCPLGPLDSLRWHLCLFRRIRRFDSEWSGRTWFGFIDYLAVFLNAGNARSLMAGLWRQLRSRRVFPTRPASSARH